MYVRNYLELVKLIFLEWVEDFRSLGNMYILVSFNVIILLIIFFD